MKRKALLTIFLALCLSLCLIFASCGSEENADGKNDNASNSTNSGTSDSTSDSSTDNSHEHVYSEWKIINEPTCTEEGKKQKTCSCGDAVTDTIEATNHTEEIVAGKEPTCIEAGLTDGKKCSVCDEILVAQEEIPATGHSYENRVCVVCNEKAPSEGLEYTLSNDNAYYIVTGIGTCTDTEVVIPSIYEGKPVTGIGANAFYNCTSLTSVTIPDSVTSIGGVEGPAFYCCKNLTNITVDEDNTEYKSIDGVLYSKDGTKLIQYPIGKKDTSFEIPDSVTSIGSFAFYDCSSLKSISIPNSVTSVGLRAFDYCSNLKKSVYKNGWYLGNEENSYLVLVGASNTSITSCTINENTKVIANQAFWTCRSLTRIVIPDGVTNIGYGAFFACSSLTSITVEANNANYKSMDGVLYSKDGTELIQYPVRKTDTSFEIPDSVTSIGNGAFSGGCTSLTSIVIPNNVTSIGDSAFANCTSLTSVVISDNVTSIGNSAFFDCSSLTSIVIPANVTSIGDDALDSCDSLTSITVDANNADYKSIDGVLYSKDGTKLIRYPIGKTETSFVIPGGVTSIGCAFSGCTNLTSIEIPDGVTSISDGAFASCTNLISVAIPNSVTSLGKSTFFICKSLKSIKIPDSITSIDYGVFYGCSSLESITIPNSVTSIGNSAFAYCDILTSVIIPSSVTSVESSAFSGCYNATIYCEAASQPSGWSSDWNNSNCNVVWGYVD